MAIFVLKNSVSFTLKTVGPVYISINTSKVTRVSFFFSSLFTFGIWTVPNTIGRSYSRQEANSWCDQKIPFRIFETKSYIVRRCDMSIGAAVTRCRSRLHIALRRGTTHRTRGRELWRRMEPWNGRRCYGINWHALVLKRVAGPHAN